MGVLPPRGSHTSLGHLAISRSVSAAAANQVHPWQAPTTTQHEHLSATSIHTIPCSHHPHPQHTAKPRLHALVWRQAGG